MLSARISDTQCFSLVTIKYQGKLISLKHDAHEVSAKLWGRLGRLQPGVGHFPRKSAHMEHGWQSPEAALLCRAPTAKIRLWWSGMPCRGGGWILRASKASRCHTEMKWHNTETFRSWWQPGFVHPGCRYQPVCALWTASEMPKPLLKHFSKWTDLQMCWALSSSSWLLSPLNFALLSKFPPVVREGSSGEMFASTFFSLPLSRAYSSHVYPTHHALLVPSYFWM